MGHVARTGERRCAYRVLVGKPKGKKIHLEEPGEDGRIIIRQIFRKWDVEALIGFI
jgi:hypothetical protein